MLSVGLNFDEGWSRGGMVIIAYIIYAERNFWKLVRSLTRQKTSVLMCINGRYLFEIQARPHMVLFLYLSILHNCL